LGYGACMGKVRNAYKILVGKLEGKRQPERPRHRCEDNIKMDQNGSYRNRMRGYGWAHLTQDRNQWQLL